MTPTPTPYILIADAFATSAKHLRALAHEQALDIVVVADGQAAVDTLRARGVPRVMILDLSLAKLDAFAVIAELRELAPADRVAVVASSPFAVLRDHATAMQARLGIAAVVAPSIARPRMEQVVRAALAASHPVAVAIKFNTHPARTPRR